MRCIWFHSAAAGGVRDSTDCLIVSQLYMFIVENWVHFFWREKWQPKSKRICNLSCSFLLCFYHSFWMGLSTQDSSPGTSYPTNLRRSACGFDGIDERTCDIFCHSELSYWMLLLETPSPWNFQSLLCLRWRLAASVVWRHRKPSLSIPVESRLNFQCNSYCLIKDFVI